MKKEAAANVTPVRQRTQYTCSAGSGQHGIDWDQQPLGEMSDSSLARMLGLSSVSIRKARIKRKIEVFHPISVIKDMGMGQVPDKVIASKTGKSRRSISRMRQELGICGPLTVNWDLQPLGSVPDVLLAKKLGVDPSSVGVARRKRGIPRGDLKWRTTEGEPATYPEAVIDLYWHQHKINHVFQKRIGKYISDWVLNDNNIAVEYAGLLNRRRIGAEYKKKLETKEVFYKKSGFDVLIITPDKLDNYITELNPKYKWNVKCLKCGSVFNNHKKHHAKGLCRPCYRKSKP